MGLTTAGCCCVRCLPLLWFFIFISMDLLQFDSQESSSSFTAQATRIITTTKVIQMRTRIADEYWHYNYDCSPSSRSFTRPHCCRTIIIMMMYFSLYTYGLLNFRYKHNTCTTNYYMTYTVFINDWNFSCDRINLYTPYYQGVGEGGIKAFSWLKYIITNNCYLNFESLMVAEGENVRAIEKRASWSFPAVWKLI